MYNIIEWTIPENYIDMASVRGFIKPTGSWPYAHEMHEDEAFIITTYFTSVWLHAHEHAASLIPGTFPSRSYAGQKMEITLGRYEISLWFNPSEIDARNNWYNDQWIAKVLDRVTNDTLEIVVESEYDYNPGHAHSEICEKFSTALVDAIISQCENEFGYTLINAAQLRNEIGDELGEMFDDNYAPRYPEWFIKNLGAAPRNAQSCQW